MKGNFPHHLVLNRRNNLLNSRCTIWKKQGSLNAYIVLLFKTSFNQGIVCGFISFVGMCVLGYETTCRSVAPSLINRTNQG